MLGPGNLTWVLTWLREGWRQERDPWITNCGITEPNKVNPISLLQGFAETLICLL